jgi:hypothetical protein
VFTFKNDWRIEMKTFTVVLFAMALSLVCLAGMAQADLITHGNFDYATDLDYWSQGGYKAGFNTGDNPPNPPSIYLRSGGSSIRGRAGDAIGYTIAAGDVLDLSFLAANLAGDVIVSSDIQAELLFDNGTTWQQWATTGVISLPPAVNADWQSLHYTFTAEAGQPYIGTALAIRLENSATSNYTGLDTISLSVTSLPTPEPGTLVLLGGGILSLLAYAWRKRK